MKRLEHSLSMKGSSWHARWYRHWVSLGGTQPEYKENLCHYVRVLLIWAPQRWFWRGKIKGAMPPFMAAILLSIIGFIISAVIIWPMQSLEGLIMIAGIVIAIAAVVPVASWVENNEDKAKRVALKLSSPLWIVPYLIFRAGKWAWSKIGNGVRKTIRWFFTRSYVVPGFAPVTVCIIAGFTVFGILATPAFLVMLLYGGITIGAVVAVFGGIFGLIALDDSGKLDGIKASAPKLFKSIIEGTTDTVKLGYTYVKLKKEGSVICPFVNFEQPEPETTSS